MTSKSEFLLLVSQSIRHEVANSLFIAGGNLAIYEDDQEPKRLENVEKSLDDINDLMGLWKDLDAIGEEQFWQDLESLLMRSINGYSVKIKIEVPEVKINANGLFLLVFENFIGNTMKYSKKEFPNVKIGAKVEDKELLIVYEDDGVGVPLNEKERIFKKGYGHGTGLGLFFVREIVNMIEGTVIENGTNGVRFEIRIPERNFESIL